MVKGTGKVLGWNLPLTVLNFLSLFFILVLIFSIDHAESLRFLIRFTARISIVIFSMAFVASSCVYLWPHSDFFRWLAKNRRHVGISFAITHLFHLLAIIALAFIDTEKFLATTTWVTFIFGGLVFVFIIFMLITSFEKPAAMLSAKQWKWLHKTGSYGIWIVFMVSYLGRVIAMQWIYLFPTLLSLATVTVRYLAWKKKKDKSLLKS